MTLNVNPDDPNYKAEIVAQQLKNTVQSLTISGDEFRVAGDPNYTYIISEIVVDEITTMPQNPISGPSFSSANNLNSLNFLKIFLFMVSNFFMKTQFF